MANLKNITDLPVVESAEGLNLIVNDNGSAKQVPASAVGGSGGADWNASEGEPGYVKNRTHYEETAVVNEPLNITWDGNGDGLFCVDGLYKVSDIVLDDEQIKKLSVTTTEVTYLIGDGWDNLVESGFITSDITSIWGDVLFCRKTGDNPEFGFLEAGIYFFSNGEGFYVSSLTGDITRTETTIKTIDEKFLPIGKPLLVNIRPTGGYSITGTANMPYVEFRNLIESNVYFGAYVCYSECTFVSLVVSVDRSDCLELRYSDNTGNPIMTVYWLPDDTFTLEDPMEEN